MLWHASGLQVSRSSDSDHTSPVVLRLQTSVAWMLKIQGVIKPEVGARQQVPTDAQFYTEQIKHWLQTPDQHCSKISCYKKMEKIHCITWPKFTALQLWLTRTSSLPTHTHTYTHTVQLVHKNQSSTSYLAVCVCVLLTVEQRLMMENPGRSCHLWATPAWCFYHWGGFTAAVSCLLPAGWVVKQTEPAAAQLVSEVHLYLINSGLHSIRVCLHVFHKKLAENSQAE